MKRVSICRGRGSIPSENIVIEVKEFFFNIVYADKISYFCSAHCEFFCIILNDKIYNLWRVYGKLRLEIQKNFLTPFKNINTWWNHLGD